MKQGSITTHQGPTNNQNNRFLQVKVLLRRQKSVCLEPVFFIFYSQCVIHIEGKPITGEYYSQILDRLDIELKQKRPQLKKEKANLLHEDNFRFHTCFTMAKIHQLCYELLPHPACSTDLAPSDYFLFSNLKK